MSGPLETGIEDDLCDVDFEVSVSSSKRDNGQQQEQSLSDLCGFLASDVFVSEMTVNPFLQSSQAQSPSTSQPLEEHTPGLPPRPATPTNDRRARHNAALSRVMTPMLMPQPRTLSARPSARGLDLATFNTPGPHMSVTPKAGTDGETVQVTSEGEVAMSPPSPSESSNTLSTHSAGSPPPPQPIALERKGLSHKRHAQLLPR
eukprot:g10459.t1